MSESVHAMAQQSGVKMFERKLKQVVSDLPVFSLSGAQVDVLCEPVQFYQSLLSGCAGACRRIVLSSLYLGDGPLCRKLVDALAARMSECSSLRVHILLDANRASRTSVIPASSLSPPPYSTSSSLSSSVSSSSHPPSSVSPSHVQESMGTTGSCRGRLQPSSLTQCQPLHSAMDRSLSSESESSHSAVSKSELRSAASAVSKSEVSSSCHVLAALMERFPQQCTVSLYHTPNYRGLLRGLLPQRANEVLGVQHMKLYVFDDDIIVSGANLSEDYFTRRQDRCVRVRECPALAQFCSDLVHTVSNLSLTMSDRREVTMPASCPVHPYREKYDGYVSLLKQRVDRLFDQWRGRTASCLSLLGSDESPGDCQSSRDTFIVPTVSLGLASLDMDTKLLEGLFSIVSSSVLSASPSRLFMATGYFNLTDSFCASIVKQPHLITSLVCAHPKANGFLNSSGMSGYIPTMYTCLLRRFHDNTAGQRDKVSIHEYHRPGWTFHGKGLWWYYSGWSLPSITCVGSSNYGYRSAYRDLEAQLLIYTRNQTLQRHLDDERRNLYLYSSPVDDTTFTQSDRHVPYWLTVITRFIRTAF